MARAVRKVVGLGILAGFAYAAWRWWDSQRQNAISEWEPQPFPYPPTPKVEGAAPNPPSSANASDDGGGARSTDATEEVPEV
jgi:hypothetical protein